MRLVTREACANAGCGATRSIWRFERTSQTGARTCSRCGAPMIARGFDLRERLEEASAPASLLDRSLHQLGLQSGDICTVAADDGDRHYLVGDDPR